MPESADVAASIWFAAANRDDAVNGGATQSSPAVFDPKRWPNRHLALRRFAGVVDGITEAHFRFDQEAAERIMETDKEAHSA